MLTEEPALLEAEFADRKLKLLWKAFIVIQIFPRDFIWKLPTSWFVRKMCDHCKFLHFLWLFCFRYILSQKIDFTETCQYFCEIFLAKIKKSIGALNYSLIFFRGYDCLLDVSISRAGKKQWLWLPKIWNSLNDKLRTAANIKNFTKEIRTPINAICGIAITFLPPVRDPIFNVLVSFILSINN